MEALVWCRPYKVKVEDVPDAKILNRRDAIVRVTSTAICGSDLHLLDGFIPFMKPGDICCRKAGTVSIPGVYGGLSDKIPTGALMNKGLTIKTGQTHVHRYVLELLEMVQSGRIDPSFVVTHRIPLSDAPRGYEMFRKKQDGCIKVVLDPAAQV